MQWKEIGFASIPLLLALASLAFDFPILFVLGVVAMAVQLWVVRQHASAGKGVDERDRPMYEPTSGLLSPWYFDLRVAEEAKRCDRYGRSMAVIVVKVLMRNGLPHDWRSVSARIAQTCTDAIRSTDLIGALAPFELGVCLVECDRAQARAVYGRLVEGLSEYECLGGIAVYPGDAISTSDLVKAARERSVIPRAA